MKLISKNKLANLIGVGNSAIDVYLSHFTLYKFVRYKKKFVKKKIYKQAMFLLNNDSINALEDYLKQKMRFGKSAKNIKIAGIGELREYLHQTV